MRQGDKVKFVDTKGLSKCKFYKKIKKNKIFTVRAVKSSGGILLEGICVGYKHELVGGGEQGFLPYRLKPVKKSKTKTKKK